MDIIRPNVLQPLYHHQERYVAPTRKYPEDDGARQALQIAKRVRRRQSMQVEPLPVAPEMSPSQSSTGLPLREVVDCAPDLLRWCNLETPFPSVAFGGYLKYYRTRESTNFANSPTPYSHPLASLSSSSSTIPAIPLFDSELPSIQPISPFDVKPMTPRPKTLRKARHCSYSESQVATNDKIPILSRWKRTTYILTPDIPPFSTANTTTTTTTALDLIVRPSLDTSRSSSSSSSSNVSTADSPPYLSPDLVSQITRRNSGSSLVFEDNTMYNDAANIFLVDSQKKRFSGVEIGLQRPDSSLSFRTANSEFSDKLTVT